MQAHVNKPPAAMATKLLVISEKTRTLSLISSNYRVSCIRVAGDRGCVWARAHLEKAPASNRMRGPMQRCGAICNIRGSLLYLQALYTVCVHARSWVFAMPHKYVAQRPCLKLARAHHI